MDKAFLKKNKFCSAPEVVDTNIQQLRNLLNMLRSNDVAIRLRYEDICRIDQAFVSLNMLEAVVFRMEWQIIETAPKDGTNILLWWPAQFHCVLTGHWAEKYNPWTGWKVSGWKHDKFSSLPTHWMPLPPSPKETP